MRKFTLFKYILIVIFIAPIFYEHFNFLPKATKYLLDILIFIYYLKFKKFTRYSTGFSKIYSTYIFAIVLITVISLIYHQESFSNLLQEARRLIYPLLLYFIIKDIFINNKGYSKKIHKLLMIIFLIQVPVTILQVVLFPTLNKLSVYTEGGSINVVDIASGTMGAGGTSTLGILIPLIIVYFYDLKIFKYSLLFIIPIILINSGGGLILFAFVLSILTIYSITQGSVKFRIRALAGIIFLIGFSFIFSTTEYFRQNIVRYEKSFIHYNKVFIEGGQQTFGGDESFKIDRTNGYKFLKEKMNNIELWVGLGFDFKSNNNKTAYQYKNDINTIIAERGFLGLLIFVLFILTFLMYVYKTLKIRSYDYILIKFLFFAVFFIGSIYNPATRSFQSWLFIVYFLALLENKDQYLALTKNINGYKYSRHRQKRGI